MDDIASILDDLELPVAPAETDERACKCPRVGNMEVEATKDVEPVSARTWISRLRKALLDNHTPCEQLKAVRLQSLCSGMATEAYGLKDLLGVRKT